MFIRLSQRFSNAFAKVVAPTQRYWLTFATVFVKLLLRHSAGGARSAFATGAVGL